MFCHVREIEKVASKHGEFFLVYMPLIKTDAYTHIGIKSGSHWVLKASLLSSYDLFTTSLKKAKQLT